MGESGKFKEKMTWLGEKKLYDGIISPLLGKKNKNKRKESK